MSKHTSLYPRAMRALKGPARASTQHVLLTLGIFAIVSGTTYHVLSTGAQSDPVQSCKSGCASMTCPSGTSAEQCAQDKTTCESGCANMGTSQSSSAQVESSSSSTCNQQPNWPDCAEFSCTAGNWTCMSMKSSSSSFSSSFGGGMNVEQCLSTCNTGTEEQKTMCKNGCNRMGQSDGGTQGSYSSSGTQGGSGGGTSGTSGTSGVQRCFFPAEWYSVSQGKQWGGTLNCTSDRTDCREGSETSPQVSSQITFKGDASSCYPTGGTSGGWSGGSGGGTQGSYSSGGMSPNEACTSGCNSMTGTEEQKSMCRNGCSTMGQSGGGQGSNVSGSRACGPNEYPTAQNPCMFSPMGGTNPMPGGTRPCAPGEQPVQGSCYLHGGTNPGNTTRMCDYYRNGPPPSCAYSSPACAVYTEPAEALSCDDPRCTSSWNRNCFTPGSRPNSEGSGGQSGGYNQGGYNQGGNNQGGYNQGGYNQGGNNQGGYGNINPGDYMRNAPGYYNGGFYPGMMTSREIHSGMSGEQMLEIQQKMQQEQETRMFDQMKSEGARQCQRFLDPLQSAFNMPKTMQDAIKGYHKKCVAGVQTATSPEEFYGLMESLRTEMTGLFEKTESCDGVESFIYGMEQGATKEAPRFIKQTEKRNPTLAKQMEQMRQETIAAVNTAKKQVAGGDCEAAQSTMETMEENFENASGSWGDEFSMLDDDRMADHFTEKMQKRGVNISAGDLQKRGIADADHMGIMSGLMAYGADNMGTFFEGEDGANIIKTLAAGGASSEQTSLMAQILEENKRLREEVGELRSQLNKTQAALADKLSTLTADTKITSQIQDFISHELQNTELTPQKADKIYEAFRDENGRELMKKGLVTNIDLNLRDWYTPIVITANKEGFMKGDPTGYFRPAAEMNQAEAAVTMARAFGVEVTEGAVPSDRKFTDYPEWSLPSIQALQVNGIDLSVLNSKPDQAISRSQVSVLLSTLLPDEASEGKSAKVFTDISGVDRKTTDAIHELSALGIANGVDNGTKYNPNGTVDRATFATYLTRSVDAAEKFLGVNAASEEATVGVPSDKESSEEYSE